MKTAFLLLFGVFFITMHYHPRANADENSHGELLSLAEFHALAFPTTDYSQQPNQWEVLWLTNDQRQAAADILGHSFNALRVRYWAQGKRTAWILDEIGKEQPITMGIVIEDKRIQLIRILAYRESRGGEIRHPFFTEQFNQLMLEQDAKKSQLDGKIDGITGATLSVRAVKKVAALALQFHQYTPYDNPAAVENP